MLAYQRVLIIMKTVGLLPRINPAFHWGGGGLSFFLGASYCLELPCVRRVDEYLCCLDIPEFVVEYGRANLLKVLGDEPSSWCQKEPPISYTYIQVRLPLLYTGTMLIATAININCFHH